MHFTEPISGSAPKFSLETKITSLIRAMGQELGLACPAQGSPVPSYRLSISYSDPVGSSTPKFSIVIPHEQSVESGSAGNLLCPAQGSPSPMFRSVLVIVC